MLVRSVLRLILILSLACCMLACSNKNQTVGDFVVALRGAGIDGSFSPKLATFIGATEGGIFTSKDDTVRVEIYRFPDAALAVSQAKSCSGRATCLAKGYFEIMIFDGAQRVLPVWESF